MDISECDSNLAYDYLYPLSLLLKSYGFNLKEDKNVLIKLSVLAFKIYFVFVCLFTIISQSVVAFRDGLQVSDGWVFIFNESTIALTFFGLLEFKKPAIKTFVTELIRTADTTLRIDSTSIRVWSKYLAVYSFASIVHIFLMTYETIVGIDNYDIYTQYVFWGWQPASGVMKITLNILVEFAYDCSIFVAEIGCSFVIILLKIITESQRKINQNFSAKEFQDFTNYWQFQKQHRFISRTVNQFNELFSTYILIFSLMKIAKVVTFCDILYIRLATSLDSEAAAFVAPMSYCTADIARGSISLFLFLFLAQQIQQNHQQRFDVLTDANLPQTYDDMDNIRNLIKTCHTTNIFTAQSLSSPVSISAAGLFTVNYHLITVIISITITYLAFVANFKQFS